jgi:hypothetical protein
MRAGMEEIKIIDTNADNIHLYGMCGYKNIKHEGYQRKIAWLKKRYAEGLKYKILYSSDDGAVGGIEYIPGDYSWRPLEAEKYMFIHCIFIIPKKFKEKGYGLKLLDEVWKDAHKQRMDGVAAVAREGSWMVGKALLLKGGYNIVDTAPPDFALLARKFNKRSPSPKFTTEWKERLAKYESGLFIFSSDQCPYIVKAVQEIGQTAEKMYKIIPNIIEMKSYEKAQHSPSPFGTFCIVYNGELIADHPISNRRFMNIMNKILP